MFLKGPTQSRSIRRCPPRRLGHARTLRTDRRGRGAGTSPHSPSKKDHAQYLPKSADLSRCTQRELDAITRSRSVRKPDHPLDQGLCAGRLPRRPPSSRCDDAGPEISCGPSSTLARVSCSSWSSYSFAAGAPRRPNSSPCAVTVSYTHLTLPTKRIV